MWKMGEQVFPSRLFGMLGNVVPQPPSPRNPYDSTFCQHRHYIILTTFQNKYVEIVWKYSQACYSWEGRLPSMLYTLFGNVVPQPHPQGTPTKFRQNQMNQIVIPYQCIYILIVSIHIYGPRVERVTSNMFLQSERLSLWLYPRL